jgi:hypothetical protein
MTTKSELLKILEDLPNDSDPMLDQDVPAGRAQQFAIVDGMAFLQALEKPDEIKNCADLALQFSQSFFEKFGHYEEMHLVFDRYDMPFSLKTATRDRRLCGQPAIAYHITDTTKVGSISMSKLLAHSKTKHELTCYLAAKAVNYAGEHHHQLVVAWSKHARASFRDATYLASEQEEADTKLMLHACDAKSRGATTIEIHSADTDVLVLAIQCYPNLCQDTVFVTSTGAHHRYIPIGPVYHALGAIKSAALPAFHAITGTDVTGRFAGKGKPTCWKAFDELDDATLSAIAQLGMTMLPSEQTISALELFVCRLYVPACSISLAQARWWLFKKKQAQSEGLPPTQAAFRPAILRAHYLMMIWSKATVPNPVLPPPENYGWKLDGQALMPVMTTIAPAPHAIIELVKCGCKTSRCATQQCKCRSNNLKCTDLCACCDIEECENWTDDAAEIESEEDEEDEEDNDL